MFTKFSNSFFDEKNHPREWKLCIGKPDAFLPYWDKVFYHSSMIETLPYAWKIHHKKWVAFTFGNTCLSQTFTECVSNQYTHFGISTWKMWLKFLERQSILIRFFRNFQTKLRTIHHSCLNRSILTKLSQILYEIW